MFSDIATVLWLKIRHVQTDIIRWLYFAGTDFKEDTDLFDRLYQLYFVVIIGAFLVLSWSALVNQVEVISATLDPALAPLFAFVFLYIIIALFFFAAFSFIKSMPLKLSLPDISYLAASSIRTGSLTITEAFLQSLGFLVLGFLGGYLCGISLESFSDLGVSAWMLACFTGLSLLVLNMWAWMLGISRFALSRQYRKRAKVVAYIALPVAAFLSFIAAAASPLSPELFSFLAGEKAFAMLLVPLVLFVGVVLLLYTLSRSLDMSALVDANWLAAELYPLRELKYQDPQRYAEIRREKKLALRGPRFTLPEKSGNSLLIARAALAHARRFESLPGLLIWCTALIPSGTVIMLTSPDPTFMFIWLIAALAYEGAAGAATTAFKEDMRNRMVRDHLPYSTLSLLLLDSLPILLAMIVLTVASSAVMCATMQVSAGAILVSSLLVLGLVLCGGVSSVRYAYAKKSVSFEAALLIVLIPICLIVFLDSLWVAILIELAILLTFAFLIRSGSEI